MKRRLAGRFLALERLEARQLLAFDPSGLEQELLQLVNRMRLDPQAEFSRLISQLNPITSPSPDVTFQLQYWHVDGNVLAQQWQSLVPAPPLAWHERLWTSALGHDYEMIRQRSQQHQLPGEPSPGERIKNAGYPARSWAESILADCVTVIQCHAAFAIDWGYGPNGIQSPPAHREVLVSARYREIGIALVPHAPADIDDVGPLVVTKNFGRRDNMGNSYVVGAVFHDANESGWYENGEGRGGATVRFTGSAGTFEVTSMTAGGYQIQLPPGTYSATAYGGGLREALHYSNIVVAGDNVWVNFRQPTTSLPSDRLEPNNEFAAATALAAGDSRQDRLSIHLPDNNDYYRWIAPATGMLTARISFAASAGKLGLTLYNASQQEVAAASAGGDSQQIQWPVTAGSMWYVAVHGVQRAVNSNYTLEVDGPGGAIPVAADDKAITDLGTPVVIDILANDFDADGDLDPRSVQITQQPLHGSLAINAQTGAATYAPHSGYVGPDRFRYVVRDATNFAAPESNVSIAVVDHGGLIWRNPLIPADADGSGNVNPQDALVIINRLNQRGSGPLDPLPAGVNIPPPYVDTSGDNYVTANDVLLVVNFLNRGRGGEGEYSVDGLSADRWPWDGSGAGDSQNVQAHGALALYPCDNLPGTTPAVTRAGLLPPPPWSALGIRSDSTRDIVWRDWDRDTHEQPDAGTPDGLLLPAELFAFGKDSLLFLAGTLPRNLRRG